MSYDIAVIGGGAAGLLSAIAAAEHKAEVTLLIGDQQPGSQLLSGECRHGIANVGSTEQLIQSFPEKGRFLNSAFETFSGRDLLDLLSEEGVATKEKNGGQILPADNNLKTVLKALKARIQAYGITVKPQSRIAKIEKKIGRVEPGWKGFTIELKDGSRVTADRLVLCTGEQTGDKQEGETWAQQFGHTIALPDSAIIALQIEDEWPQRAQGASLRDAEVIVRAEDQKIASFRDDVLFTAMGLAGPAILGVAKAAIAAQKESAEPIVIGIRTDGDLLAEDWEARLQMALREHPRQLLKSLVARWWPASLAEALLEVHSIPPEVMANQVTKLHRRQTAEILDEFRLQLKRSDTPAVTLTTSGGVALAEIDPHSMQSRKSSGLYIAGELLDIDGVNEGYTLQAACATGYTAGWAAATDREE